MDIAALATNLSNISLASDVSTRVAKKTLDIADQQGQAAIKLLEDAAEVGRQTNGSRQTRGLNILA